MEVEGIHVPSEDTEQGNRVHRRVDKPSREERPDGSEKPDPNRTVRSLTLTSAALQLTATMDLVEIDGVTAVPVEYRNACLSFGYSMLTHECTAALRTARLEPSIGAYHVSRPGRPALSLDLMEPFRPLIADSIAITAFNRGELQPGHFLRTSAGAMFTEDGRKAFSACMGGGWTRR